MKILLVSHSAGLLGAERSLLDIASGMQTDGHQLVVSVPEDGPLVARLRAQGISTKIVPTHSWMGRHHWFPPVGLWRLWQARRDRASFEQLISSELPDIVISNTAVVPAASFAARAVGVSHLWIVRESLGANRQLTSILPMRWIVSTIVKNSDALCVISEYVESRLRALGADPTTSFWRVPPNPEISPSIPGATRVGSPEGTRVHIFKVFLPGHLSWEKGQHRAILAVSRARRNSAQELRLTIAGTGGFVYGRFLHLLARLYRITDQVEFVGWEDDLTRAYLETDVTVVTSANEALGRVFVESTKLGTPVVAFDRGAARETLGDAGIYVGKFSWRALASVLSDLTHDSLPQREGRRRLAQRQGEELSQRATQYEALRVALSSLRGGTSPGLARAEASGDEADTRETAS